MTARRRAPLAPGVWGVLATPFTPGGDAVDIRSLERLASSYERIGATGLTVLGVFGEAASLTAAERTRVLETVVAATGLPLVVGIAQLATRPAIDDVEAAQSACGSRLAAVMLQANSARADRVCEHLSAIEDRTGAAVVLQDYPVASRITITAETLIGVVASQPCVVAVKAESPPTAVAVRRIAGGTDVTVFGGLGGQGLLDELAAGAGGAMTGFSYPEALIACVAAHARGDDDSARASLIPFLPLINFEQQPGIALAIRKECLRRRGLIDDASVRSPGAGFPEELGSLLDAHLRAVAAPTGSEA